MASKTLQVTLTAKDNMSATLDKAGDSAKTMGESLENAGDAGSRSIADLSSELTQVGGVLTGFGIAITAALGFAVSSSMDLESAMANVNSIAQVSDEELGALTDQVLALSVEMAQSPTGLADALYNIQGSGFAADEALGILETSAVAAVAGLTDTETAARAVTAVLNAYGLEATEAGNVSDTLFAAVDSGVISFAELADSLGRVLPLASSLKVPLEEISAAYAALTIQGVSASEAETGIAALLTSALNPTVALTEALKEYGIESAEALIQTEGFAGFLEFLQEASGGSTAAMSELTGNVRSNNAALALGADDGQVYTGMIEDMTAAASDGETTLGVFAIQSDTTRFALQELGTTFEAVKIAVGDAISPFVRLGAEGLEPVLQGFLDLPEPVQTIVTGMTALTGGVALAGGALLLALPRVVAFQTALAALGGARGILTTVGGGLGKLTLGINPLVIGLGAAAVAGVYLFQKFSDGAEYVQELDTEISNLAETVDALKLQGLDEAAANVETFKKQIDEVIAANNAFENMSNDEYDTWLDDQIAKLESMGVPLDELQGKLEETFVLKNADAFEEDIATISQLLQNPLVDAALLGDELDRLNAAFEETGDINAYADGLDAITKNTADYKDETIAATDAIDATTDAMERQATGIDRYIARQRSALEILGSLEQAERDNLAWQTERERTAYANQEISLQTQKAMAEAAQLVAEEFIVAGMALAGFDDALSQINMAVGTQFSQLAEDVGTANSALQNTFRIVVSNTDAMGATAQATEDWILGLTQAEEGQSRLQEARSAGLITEQAYGAALGAQRDIQAANRDIQNDIVAIQANQAPLIADLTAKQAAYISTLADLPEQQQLIALGWMDANTAAQANEAIMIAAAAAAGEWGESGQAAAGQFIEGAIAANPVLEELLTDIGLVARDHEGNLVINFSGAEGARSEIDLLNESIRTLADVMDDGAINGSIGIQVTGKAETDDLVGTLIDIDGTTASASVNADTGTANTEIDTTSELLTNLDGTTATVSATTSGGEDVEALSSTVADLPPSTSIAVSVFAEIGSLFDMIRVLDETSATITVSVDEQGFAEIGSMFDMVRALDETSVTISIISSTHGAQIALDNVTSAIDNIAASNIMVRVEADTGTAIGALNDVVNAANNLAISQITVNVSADTGTAVTGLNSVTVAANAIPPSESVTVVALAEGATAALNGVTAAANAIPESESVTVTVFGAAGAVSALNSVTNAANSIPSSRSTTITTNRVTNNVQTYSSRRGGAYAHGGMVGVPHFAGGGMVPFWAGENGPELAHFAGGGTALAPHEGLYAAPPMTYISPNNAVSNEYGGHTFHIAVTGGNREEIRAVFADEIVPEIGRAMREYERGMGV